MRLSLAHHVREQVAAGGHRRDETAGALDGQGTAARGGAAAVRRDPPVPVPDPVGHREVPVLQCFPEYLLDVAARRRCADVRADGAQRVVATPREPLVHRVLQEPVQRARRDGREERRCRDRHGRAPRETADPVTDNHHDDRVRHTQNQAQEQVRDRPAEHPLDVVKVVAGDGQRRRHRQERDQDSGRDVEEQVGAGDRGREHDDHERRDRDDGHGHPQQAAALVALRSAEADEQRRGAGDEQQVRRDGAGAAHGLQPGDVDTPGIVDVLEGCLVERPGSQRGAEQPEQTGEE